MNFSYPWYLQLLCFSKAESECLQSCIFVYRIMSIVALGTIFASMTDRSERNEPWTGGILWPDPNTSYSVHLWAFFRSFNHIFLKIKKRISQRKIIIPENYPFLFQRAKYSGCSPFEYIIVVSLWHWNVYSMYLKHFKPADSFNCLRHFSV